MEERIERNQERKKGKEKEEEEGGELNVDVSSYSPFSSYERQGLPNEVLMLIFSFLRREIDLFNICLVCKRWKSLMDTDIIWQTILYRRYRQDRGALNMVMASFREEQEQQALEFSENLLFGSASSSDRDTAAPFANNSTSSVDEKTAWPDAYRSPTTFATSPTLFSPTTSTGTSISSSLDGTTSNSNSTSSSPSYSYSTPPPKDLNWKRFYLTRLKQDRLWKLTKLGHQGTLVGHTEEIRCLALVGSRVITGSLDRSIRVWDATNYTLQNTLYNNVAGVLCLQPISTKTSERGTKIVTGNSDRTIKVWNIDSGLCTNTIHGHTGEVECLHVEDRFLVTGSRDTTVRVWDSSSYACLMTLEGHRAPINCIQVGGRTIVSAAADRTIKVWDLGTGTCLRTLNGKMNGSKQANILPSRQKGILCLQFNADLVVVGTGDSYLEMYDLVCFVSFSFSFSSSFSFSFSFSFPFLLLPFSPFSSFSFSFSFSSFFLIALFSLGFFEVGSVNTRAQRPSDLFEVR
jgi:WD40 repeat protein